VTSACKSVIVVIADKPLPETESIEDRHINELQMVLKNNL
jgi:hypothetical protein